MAFLGLPVAAASVLVACGGSTGSTGYGAPAQGGGGARTGVVNVHDISGLGPTLVDGTGKTLYFSDQESGGSVHCVGGCLGFWFPATAGDATAADAQAPGLASLRRPDNGKQQITYQGKPLYTFGLDDSPGKHMGDNFSDDFDGRHFTWHAATVGAPRQVNPAPPSQSDSGYGY
ncbi:COG4315 family predicted lipoprotein [Amycolatopsis alkalitolerans]|uniref:hypothetical protein n=1 Tax=Amycolatopsis alkalitolerans TaxID=2547244 RepID=UPI001358BF33|nr:hypothetical protein [Amycolatopsis alkalitolerans]